MIQSPPMWLLLGCNDPAPADKTAEAPCSGGWPGDPETAVHVRSDGDDAGTGSQDSPVATLAAALALSGDGGTVILGPGDIVGGGTVVVQTSIYGCGAGESSLVDADPTDPDSLIVVAADATLEGFTAAGGRRAIQVQGDPTVTLRDVHVFGATRAGIVVYGGATLTLTDVQVEGTLAEDDVGYGVSALGGDGATPANISMEGGWVRDSTGVGFLADSAVVRFQDVEVSATAPTSEGLLGRGVSLQNLSALTMDGCTVADNADAGIFSAASYELVVRDSAVSGTASGGVPDSDDTTGDGIVAIRGPDAASFPVSTFSVRIEDAQVDGNARAGILLEDVTVEALSGVTGANGLQDEGTSTFAQGDADTTSAADPVATPDAALTVNTAAVIDPGTE